MNTKTREVTPQQRIAILKHLAGGKDLDAVALIIALPRDQVFDIARHHGYPDTSKLSWAVDVLTKKADEEAAAAIPAGTPPERTRPAPVAAPAPTAMTKPDEIRVLLNAAKSNPSKRIQAAADRCFDQLDRLRTLLREDQEKNAEKRARDAEKARARAEVERLERELAAAKAKLRGNPVPAEATSVARVGTTAPKGEYPCRNDGCDEVKDTPQGRSLHERRHCPHRIEAVS